MKRIYTTNSDVKLWIERHIDLPFFKMVIISTFVIGLIANAQSFFGFSPASDSTMTVNIEDHWNISLGRFVTPYYLTIRSHITIPWIIGLLSLLYISIAVYAIAKSLRIEHPLSVGLISGVLTINTSLANLNAIYFHLSDVFMLSFMLACIGVYCLERFSILRAFCAISCFCCSLGIYQSYISSALGLMLIIVTRDFLINTPIKRIFKRSLMYGIVIICSAVFYLFLTYFFQGLYAIEFSMTPNSVGTLSSIKIKSILEYLPTAYKTVIHFLFFESPFLSLVSSVFNRIITLFTVTAVLVYVLCKKMWRMLPWLGFISIVAPLVLNLAAIASVGASNHTLMYYPMYFIFIAEIFVWDFFYKENKNVFPLLVYTGLLSASLFSSMTLINGAYHFRQLVYDASLVDVACIVHDIEKIQEYEEGVTPVCLVGAPAESFLNNKYPRYRQYFSWTGSIGSSITFDGTFSHFTENILGRDINQIIDNENRYGSSEFVINMPTYPKAGYCELYDGVVIVKLK